MEEAEGCMDISQEARQASPTPKTGIGFGVHSAFHSDRSLPPEVSGKTPLTWVEEEGNVDWNFAATVALASGLVSVNDVAFCKLKELERLGPKWRLNPVHCSLSVVTRNPYLRS